MEIDEGYCEGAILVHQSAEERVFGARRMHCQLKNNWCKISVPAGTFINLVPVHPPVIDRQNYPDCPVNIVAYRSSMTGNIFLTQKNASEIEFSLFRKTLLL